MRLSFLFFCIASLCNASEDSLLPLDRITLITQQIHTLFISMNRLNQSICHETYKDPETKSPQKSLTGVNMSVNAIFMNKRVSLAAQLSTLEGPVTLYKNQVRRLSAETIDLSKKINGFTTLLAATKQLEEEMKTQIKQQDKEKLVRKVKLGRSVSIESEGSI